MSKNALELCAVKKLYTNNHGIRSVDLTVPAGQIFGFLGPNGSGKTTTIRAIMDFIRPDSGTIKIFGLDAHNDAVETKNLIGYVPSEKQLYEQWTGQQHIDFYLQNRTRSNSDVAKKLNLDVHTPVKHLSSGNKQKLALSLALCGNPALLIMDEPTSGLDPLLQNTIYELLREYQSTGGTVFFSSHNLPEVEKVCSQIGIIKDGVIVAEKSVQDLTDMSIHIITVATRKPLTAATIQKAGGSLSHQTGQHTTISVKGDLNPIINELGKHAIIDLEVNHASLEDVFLEYYA